MNYLFSHKTKVFVVKTLLSFLQRFEFKINGDIFLRQDNEKFKIILKMGLRTIPPPHLKKYIHVS